MRPCPRCGFIQKTLTEARVEWLFYRACENLGVTIESIRSRAKGMAVWTIRRRAIIYALSKAGANNSQIGRVVARHPYAVAYSLGIVELSLKRGEGFWLDYVDRALDGSKNGIATTAR